MATGDIYEVLARQSVVGGSEEFLNVFHFRQSSAEGSSADLANTIQTQLMPPILFIQSPKIQWLGLSTRNLFTVDDFTENTFDPGDVIGTSSSGDMLPVFNAVTFRLVRTNREIRNGFKRFVGIPESVQVDGLITDEGYIDNLNALSSALSEPINDVSLDGTYDLVVVKRILDPDPTPSGEKPRYRLPTSSGEAVYSDPSRVLVNLFVRHQVSRGN